jgi:hypothetical protein
MHKRHNMNLKYTTCMLEIFFNSKGTSKKMISNWQMTMHENKIWFTYNLVSLDEQNKHLQARTFYERQKVKDEKNKNQQ